MNPNDAGFAILNAPNGDYVQTAAARLRSTVELRRKECSSHFTIGEPTTKLPSRAQINAKHSAIDLMSNEVLDLDDAIAIFASFLASSEVPDPYVLRAVPD